MLNAPLSYIFSL